MHLLLPLAWPNIEGVPETVLVPTSVLEFEGVRLPAPAQPERYLELMYGDGKPCQLLRIGERISLFVLFLVTERIGQIADAAKGRGRGSVLHFFRSICSACWGH